MNLVLMVLGLAGLSAEPATWRDFDHTHAGFTRVLKKHVTKGWVNYTTLRKDREELDAYLKGLEGIDGKAFARWGKKQRIAFWINAYNAYTLKLIIDNKPVKSIKDLGGLFSSVFSKNFIPLKNLFGKVVNLNTIEHDTLREKFAEPRIHFALVCASKSCPSLRPEAYRAVDLDAQLNAQARLFLRNTTKNRYDASTRTVYLSKIFDWFDEDFEKAKGTVVKYVAQYLSIPGEVRVRYLDYDWTMNGK